jgi:hypothetical protein
MELDELKTAWAELERRLEERDRQVTEMQRHTALLGAQSRLRLVTRGQIMQLLIGVLLAVWGGSTWVDDWGRWHLVMYGLGVHAYGLVLLATAAVQLVQVAAIDYSRPVAIVQRGIVDLKRARVRSERLLLAVGGVGWVPITFLIAHHAGMDIWATRPSNVLANLGVGLAISITLLWASARYPAWLERSAQGKHLADIERDLDEMGHV